MILRMDIHDERDLNRVARLLQNTGSIRLKSNVLYICHIIYI